jgi:hypothetical protein
MVTLTLTETQARDLEYALEAAQDATGSEHLLTKAVKELTVLLTEAQATSAE